MPRLHYGSSAQATLRRKGGIAMIAFCHSCKGVAQVEKAKGVRCPKCGTHNSLERITQQEVDALKKVKA